VFFELLNFWRHKKRIQTALIAHIHMVGATRELIPAQKPKRYCVENVLIQRDLAPYSGNNRQQKMVKMNRSGFMDRC
jgi:hypothetical protein